MECYGKPVELFIVELSKDKLTGIFHRNEHLYQLDENVYSATQNRLTEISQFFILSNALLPFTRPEFQLRKKLEDAGREDIIVGSNGSYSYIH